MIPIKDDAPRARFPYWVLLLIAVNLWVFGWQLGLDAAERQAFAFRYGLVPSSVVPRWEQLLQDPGLLFGFDMLRFAVVPLVSSAFLHAGPLHLLGNLLFLWVFGDNVESRFGYKRFPIFYLLCAMGAGVVHAGMQPDSGVPMVGASGAISGCLGAYLVLHPRAQVKLLLPFLIIVFVDIRAWVMLPIWFAIQLPWVQHALGFLEVQGVAYWAHIGGFLLGIALLPLLLIFNPDPLKAKERARRQR
ncbi:MAG: rhomboid family intramembrane serine protease [Planctomycetota bacterium]|nr:MAG: rhomboid family intramembrane serine protease [Planctomycetota bacterium]